jgi:hypothetical protein
MSTTMTRQNERELKCSKKTKHIKEWIYWQTLEKWHNENFEELIKERSVTIIYVSIDCFYTMKLVKLSNLWVKQ